MNPDHTEDDRAITPDRMSDALAQELVQEIDFGGYELTSWETNFIESNLQKERFSLKQKEVIYKIARRLHLI